MKWGLTSLGVLVLLVVVESLVVELRPESNSAEQGERLAAGDTAHEVGRNFESLDSFLKYQESQGYVFLGRFQDRWPATVIDCRTAKNEISFELSGGKHRYPGFDGYHLKEVRFSTREGTEAVVVLRSMQRTWP